jgi:K(+)-stimulated pyrophosphate-energized sodium pump
MNILIKLMSIVSLVLAPTLAKMHPTKAAVETKSQTVEMKVIQSNNTATTTANTVTVSADPKMMIEALTKDGILKATDKLNIEVNNDKVVIIVNGKPLTDDQIAKYSSLLQKK